MILLFALSSQTVSFKVTVVDLLDKYCIVALVAGGDHVFILPQSLA